MRYLNKHAAQDKRLLALERERERLHEAGRRSHTLRLERPVRRGWIKTYVLRASAAHRRDAALFREVLEVINVRVSCASPAFVSRDGSPVTLQPRVIQPNQWRSLGWPHRIQRLFVFGHWPLVAVNGKGRRPRRNLEGYSLTDTSWLREHVEPDLVRHVPIAQGAIDTRTAEIERQLANAGGQDRLNWLHGRSGRRCYRFEASRASRRAMLFPDWRNSIDREE